MSDEIKQLEDEIPTAEPSAELTAVALDEVIGGKKTASITSKPVEYLQIKMTDVL